MSINTVQTHLIFKGLSDPHRLEILTLLKQSDECNCELSDKLDIPLSTLAHHMKVLLTAGLVSARKDGKWTYYHLEKEQFKLAEDILKEYHL